MEAVPAAAVAAHVVFGSLWLGKDFFSELVLLPGLRAVRSAGELQPYQAILARDRAWDIPVALGTFLTGLVLLVIRHGTLDPGALWQLPRARPILIALVVVLALVLYGWLVLGPNGRRIVAADLRASATSPLAPEVTSAIAALSRLMPVETAGLLSVVILMVTASSGGF